MIRLKTLRSALIGGASVLTLVHPAAAKVFDIPGGDLAAALGAYMKQAGVNIIYSDDGVRGHRSRGAKGDYSETAALTQILRGTGFAAQTMPWNAIGIVPLESKPVEREPTPAEQLAQAARPVSGARAESTAIETVVVTAQKKKEDIQQVPIAITAMSQRELTERQIAGGPDLVKEVPNLTFSKTNFSGYNLEIRGIGTQAISVTTDPAVAVAFNDIPFIRNHFFEQEFFDLDNLEVLRGPQGTLYGRNATAGVVNIISAKPTDTYEAMLSADVGNYDSRRYEGMLNLPIVGDTLDLRIAGEWTKRDGYTEDSTLNTSVDGRDLWSGRMTIGWKPTSDIQAYFIWEHFSEDDDRLRSGKQLCKTDPGLTEVGGVSTVQASAFYGGQSYFSQGCLPTSLYSADAFEVPNGESLPYYEALGVVGAVNGQVDPYAESTQSTNLREIESSILPTYKAKNDTLEFNANWTIDPILTFTSQTGYNHDFLWSTEDFNRFNSSPGLFDPNDGNNEGGQISPSGVFCDPQLGCSNKLEAEDLSEEHAWQASQEFRLSSNFSGPLNFSAGLNYLHYETEENYYVFINAITLFKVIFNNPNSPWIPGVSDNIQCLGTDPFHYQNPKNGANAQGCGYIDPNPISSLDNEGHNYYLNQNPYVLNSYAGFGEVYYDATKDLKLTAGARWTDDQKHFTDIPSWIGAGGWGYPVSAVVDQQWDQWTGRFTADWSPDLGFTDQSLIYASAAHGYKAGGANPPGAVILEAGDLQPTHPFTFKPEFIEAFELGSKNTMLNGGLTVNGDIFYYNYTGYQISQIVDRTAINLNFNAHVEGAELETNWEPLPGLKFGFASGFEDAVLAGGSQAVDLMDRTAGNPNWVLVKPFLTYASNCILPVYVVADILKSGLYIGNLDGQGACGEAYGQHIDPVTGAPYTPNPTEYNCGFYPPNPPTYCPLPPLYAGYPGFNPLTAPNGGAGFSKNLSGNQLPNAPHFTTSLTAEYTMPVSDDWAATFHTDFYWQSQQWARVFEDSIDKIHGYSNVNLSLILTSANGWDVMAYVKNVFDVTAITGTFLNSDDTGLTTNVFLTDPRLFGVRVTKHLDEADGFWGSEYSGNGFFTDLFSDADNGKPPLWIELGGNFSLLDDGQQAFAPPFVRSIPSDLPSPVAAQKPPSTGLDWEGKVSFEPDDTDWIFTAAVRYGRSAIDRHAHKSTSPAPIPLAVNGFHLTITPTAHYIDTKTSGSESHAIFDFMAGKDVGLGMLGGTGSSVLSGGVRAVAFASRSASSIFTDPDFKDQVTAVPKYVGRHHNYSGSSTAKRSFHGIGPALSWNGSTPVSGDEQNGEIAIDWGANAAVLFGRQKAGGQHRTGAFYSCFNDPFETQHGCHVTSSHYQRSAAFNRSRMVAVPNLGGFVGLSMKYDNAKVSFGYRADEFFDAMDGGIDTRRSDNVGFFGPFASISIGLGG
jgi:iron complex outermembrane receptor protein